MEHEGCVGYHPRLLESVWRSLKAMVIASLSAAFAARWVNNSGCGAPPPRWGATAIGSRVKCEPLVTELMGCAVCSRADGEGVVERRGRQQASSGQSFSSALSVASRAFFVDGDSRRGFRALGTQESALRRVAVCSLHRLSSKSVQGVACSCGPLRFGGRPLDLRQSCKYDRSQRPALPCLRRFSLVVVHHAHETQ